MDSAKKELLEKAAAANIIPPPYGQLTSAGIVLYTYANELFEPVKALIAGKKPQWSTVDQQNVVRLERYLHLLYGTDTADAIQSVLFVNLSNINFKERSIVLTEFIKNNKVTEKLTDLYYKYSLDFLGKKFLDETDITKAAKKNGARPELDNIIRAETVIDFMTVSNTAKNKDIRDCIKGAAPVDAWKTISDAWNRYFEKYGVMQYVEAVRADAIKAGYITPKIKSLLEQAKLSEAPKLDLSAGLSNPKVIGGVDDSGSIKLKTAFGFDLGSGFIWVVGLLVLLVLIFKK